MSLHDQMEGGEVKIDKVAINQLLVEILVNRESLRVFSPFFSHHKLKVNCGVFILSALYFSLYVRYRCKVLKP